MQNLQFSYVCGKTLLKLRGAQQEQTKVRDEVLGLDEEVPPRQALDPGLARLHDHGLRFLQRTARNIHEKQSQGTGQPGVEARKSIDAKLERMLTEDGRILPAVLSMRVNDVLAARTPSDLRFFPAEGRAA